jgi:ribosomal protein S18 acetylase RimI-like enzyme
MARNIYRLAVGPEHRRRGIARRLVAEISRELFAKGATRLSALVEHEHQWAIDFWDSARDLGYERDPRFARYLADRGAD